MKFATALSAAAVACASLVSADSQPFHFLSIRSGSDFQYATVHAENGVLYLGHDGETKNAVITDNGHLKFGDDYIAINDQGFLSIAAHGLNSNINWAIVDGLLKYNGMGFSAVPDGGKFALGICPMRKGSVGVAIRAQSSGSGPVPDFPAPASPSSAAAAPTTY